MTRRGVALGGNRESSSWPLAIPTLPTAAPTTQLASETNLPPTSSTLWSSPRPWSQPTSPGWKASSGASSLCLATGTRPSASESAPPVSRHRWRPGCCCCTPPARSLLPPLNHPEKQPFRTRRSRAPPVWSAVKSAVGCVASGGGLLQGSCRVQLQ